MSSDSKSVGSEILSLPHYDVPPVQETFLSVSFADLEKWNIPHFGLYWQGIRSEYSKFEVRPPLASQIETFGDAIESPVLEFLTQPPIRCWFIHQKENRLLQVQNDRFIFNWRKTKPEDGYPRFDEALRGEFEAAWTHFKSFLEAESIPPPQVEQCEISYINHIPLEGGWRTYTSLVTALTAWPGAMNKKDFLPNPEDVAFNTRYLLPGGQGRLHIQLQPAIRNIDGKKVVQLVLTARGRPSSSDTSELLRWFDMGREWIVRGFTEFTSEKMHETWQRRQ